MNAAAHLARPIQARRLEAALGNLGLAYFHLGDFEKALSNFQQAEKEAKEIGTTARRSTGCGMPVRHYMLGDLQEAKIVSTKRLKLRQIDNLRKLRI